MPSLFDVSDEEIIHWLNGVGTDGVQFQLPSDIEDQIKSFVNDCRHRKLINNSVADVMNKASSSSSSSTAANNNNATDKDGQQTSSVTLKVAQRCTSIIRSLVEWYVREELTNTLTIPKPRAAAAGGGDHNSNSNNGGASSPTKKPKSPVSFGAAVGGDDDAANHNNNNGCHEDSCSAQLKAVRSQGKSCHSYIAVSALMANEEGGNTAAADDNNNSVITKKFSANEISAAQVAYLILLVEKLGQKLTSATSFHAVASNVTMRAVATIKNALEARGVLVEEWVAYHNAARTVKLSKRAASAASGHHQHTRRSNNKTTNDGDSDEGSGDDDDDENDDEGGSDGDGANGSADEDNSSADESAATPVRSGEPTNTIRSPLGVNGAFPNTNAPLSSSSAGGGSPPSSHIVPPIASINGVVDVNGNNTNTTTADGGQHDGMNNNSNSNEGFSARGGLAMTRVDTLVDLNTYAYDEDDEDETSSSASSSALNNVNNTDNTTAANGDDAFNAQRDSPLPAAAEGDGSAAGGIISSKSPSTASKSNVSNNANKPNVTFSTTTTMTKVPSPPSSSAYHYLRSKGTSSAHALNSHVFNTVKEAVSRSIQLNGNAYGVRSSGDNTAANSNTTSNNTTSSSFLNNWAIDFKKFATNCIEELEVLEGSMENMTGSLCRNAAKHIHEREVVLTVGCSHSTLAFFYEAAKTKTFTLIILESPSTPQRTTQHLVTILKQVNPNIVVEVHPESNAYAIMSGCSKVFVSCDSVLATGGALCHVGTHPICLAARIFSTPVIVVAMTVKLTPWLPVDPTCSSLIRVSKDRNHEMPCSLYQWPATLLPTAMAVGSSAFGSDISDDLEYDCLHFVKDMAALSSTGGAFSSGSGKAKAGGGGGSDFGGGFGGFSSPSNAAGAGDTVLRPRYADIDVTYNVVEYIPPTLISLVVTDADEFVAPHVVRHIREIYRIEESEF